MNVEIVKEKSNVVNQLNNKIYVSDKYEDQVGSMVKIYRQSGQVIADANGLLIKNGSGQSINWQLNVKDCIINTADSFIKYKVKYTMTCTAPAPNAGAICVPILNPEQQGATLCPGRYYVRDAILWCQPAILTANQDIKDFSTKEFAICQFPLNSTNIIRRSSVTYGGKTITDDDVCYETPLLQLQMSEEYQAAYNTQYFEQNVDNVLEFVNIPQKIDGGVLVPGTWTLPAQGLYNYSFYKTYTISLNLLNSVFDNQGRFYIIPDARSDPEIRIELQSFSLAKLFFTEQYADIRATGISEIDLYLYIKKSLTINETMEAHQFITRPYKRFSADKLTLSGGYNNSSVYLNTGHESTNDVFLCLNNPDENAQDSCKLKQRYTVMNSTQVMQYWNKQFSEYMFLFFNDFNLVRGQNYNNYFTENISDPIMFKHELLKSMGTLKQFNTSPSQALNNIMKMMTKYAIIRVNLEAFKGETNEAVDPVLDGYYSMTQKILCKFNFRIYNLHKGTVYAVDENPNEDGILPYKSCCGIASSASVIEVKAYQQYDDFFVINTQQKTIQDQEQLN